MSLLAMFGGRARQRARAVDGFSFPAGVRQRFSQHYGGLSADDLAMAEAATRQWFRIVAGNPRARLAVPCTAVERLWQELTLHTHEYADLCDRAFGRHLPYRSDGRQPAGSAGTATTAGTAAGTATTAGTAAGAADMAESQPHQGVSGGPALLRTLALARRDEGCDDQTLPLLFRVDADLKLPDGRRYLVGCGGRHQCFSVRGRTCLRHLAGVPKKKRDWGSPPRRGHGGAYHGDGDILDPGGDSGWGGWGGGDGGGWGGGDGGGGGGGD